MESIKVPILIDQSSSNTDRSTATLYKGKQQIPAKPAVSFFIFYPATDRVKGEFDRYISCFYLLRFNQEDNSGYFEIRNNTSKEPKP
jgi:hypothetical protein